MNEIRDPIYGFIELTDTEIKIINTPIFQRLRRIKQLAMAYLVYPTANHTRFDHSLGVFHVANKMAKKLLPEEEERQLIRYAALLHDVGHGPFSHVSESIFGHYIETENKNKIHEKITLKLIENDEQLNKILSLDQISQITGLLKGKSENFKYSIMKEIVSGALDADKMDYLLRDSYFCGVKYGIFDLDRMINILDFYKENSNIHLAIASDGINTLEQFVLAKYYMTRQVYRHKVRLVTDSMIVRGIELGIEKDEIPFLKNLYIYKDDADYLNNYLKYVDEKILFEILDQKRDSFAYKIFNNLNNRNLFKIIFSENIKYLLTGKARDKLIEINKDIELKNSIEEKIASCLGCEKEFVIVNGFQFKSVKEMSRDDDEGKLIILSNDGSKREFQDESLIFKSIDDTLNEIYFQVYAPFEFGSVQEKEKKQKKIKDDIIQILKDMEV